VVSVPGVLLTGGASTRMGRDKATLVVDGEMLAVRAARILQAACDPVVEVGPGVTDLRAVRESPPGSGPLAGLLAAYDALEADGSVLLLACDLPFVTDAVVRMLVEHPATGSVVPIVEGHEQYACARWSAAAVAAARGGTALRDLTRAEDATSVAVADSRLLEDVDTPDDLRRLGLS
jgi:molybdopterin-guanine dinucleotide biosynthesis protein A